MGGPPKESLTTTDAQPVGQVRRRGRGRGFASAVSAASVFLLLPGSAAAIIGSMGDGSPSTTPTLPAPISKDVLLDFTCPPGTTLRIGKFAPIQNFTCQLPPGDAVAPEVAFAKPNQKLTDLGPDTTLYELELVNVHDRTPSVTLRRGSTVTKVMYQNDDYPKDIRAIFSPDKYANTP